MSENKTTDVLAKLRAQFPPELIGKLPRVTCQACSKGQCGEHRKARCDVCKSWISERHIHIDYVGHADVTARLLESDPAWNWEPKAEDEHGLPLFDTDDKGNPVGLWIKLTVGGVTRLGYGSCPSNQNDAVKVLIGDALRNAAMRFGVALDLWAKGDRADPTAENATASAGTAARRQPRQRAQQARAQQAGTDPEWLAAMTQEAASFTTQDEGNALWRRVNEKGSAGGCTVEDGNRLKELIKARFAELPAAKPEPAAAAANGNGAAS